MYDLIVIGGGPAGTSAAITAAQSGARVLLLEKSRFPRHKVCGEFVSAESLSLLGHLLSQDFAPLLHNSIRIFESRIFLDGKILHARISPPAASIPRFYLDAALWDSAQNCGVEVLEQTTVRKISGQGPFSIESSRQTYEARAVINATGRWSNLSMSAIPDANGDRQSRTKWLGVKAHFTEMSPSLSVDLYFFPGGYCGVQPVSADSETARSNINACAMVRADVATTLAEVFQQNPELRERSRHWQPLSSPASTSPLIFRQPEPVEENILRAGDAAAFVDPFVGDGISLALRSGALAAQCLQPFFAGRSSLAEAAVNYQQSYKNKLASVYRASSQLRRLLNLPPAVRRPLISVLGKSPRLRDYLVTKTR